MADAKTSTFAALDTWKAFADVVPATKETLLDLWGRWTAWLDKYVKNAGPKGKDVS